MRERKLTQSFISVASHSLSGDIGEDREEGSSLYWTIIGIYHHHMEHKKMHLKRFDIH